MSRKAWITFVVLILLVAFVVWAWGRITSRDRDLQPTRNHGIDDESLLSLNGRVLVWSTAANVPLEVNLRGQGYGFLQLMGVPKRFRPFDLRIGREPVRDEWNVAMLELDFRRSHRNVEYLTENDGTYVHTNISADGRYIVATREEGSTQNLVRINPADGSKEAVSFSHSRDRWPSSSRDGSRILFHSYRDGNQGGDLYLAIEDRNAEGGWRTVRLTDAPEFSHVWPRMSADGIACVAVERRAGEEAGRVVLWSLQDETLRNPMHLTNENDGAMFPSLSADGGLCCWQGRSEAGSRLFLWSEEFGTREIAPPDGEGTDAVDFVQPTLSADGGFITFVEDHREVGADRIGVYDVNDDAHLFFSGCDGSVMFPALSDRMGLGHE